MHIFFFSLAYVFARVSYFWTQTQERILQRFLGVVRRCMRFDVLSQSSKGNTADIKQLAQHSVKKANEK